MSQCILCVAQDNSFPLLLPAWPRDAKRLDSPVTRPLKKGRGEKEWEEKLVPSFLPYSVSGMIMEI